MNSIVNSLALFFFTFGFLLFNGCGSVPVIAVVKNLQGSVQDKISPPSLFQKAKDNDPLQKGGAVKTGEESSAMIVYSDHHELSVKPRSFFEVHDGNSLGKQTEGTIIYRVKKQKSELTVQTPHGVTAVSGTTFLITIASDASHIWLEEGSISFTSLASGKKVSLSPGQMLVAPAVGKISPPKDVNPFELDSLFNPGGSKKPVINQH